MKRHVTETRTVLQPETEEETDALANIPTAEAGLWWTYDVPEPMEDPLTTDAHKALVVPDDALTRDDGVDWVFDAGELVETAALTVVFGLFINILTEVSRRL